jgi:hypothetical protein
MSPIKHGSREAGPGKAGGPIVASAATACGVEYTIYSHVLTPNSSTRFSVTGLSTSSRFVPGNTTN